MTRDHINMLLNVAITASNTQVWTITQEQLERFAAVVAAAEREKAETEIINLKTVMIAAAEVIAAHWKAHCDAEGYGPTNLMYRLEKGIPAQYGYTAGDFERLRAENESLRAAIRARGENK